MVFLVCEVMSDFLYYKGLVMDVFGKLVVSLINFEFLNLVYVFYCGLCCVKDVLCKFLYYNCLYELVVNREVVFLVYNSKICGFFMFMGKVGEYSVVF